MNIYTVVNLRYERMTEHHPHCGVLANVKGWPLGKAQVFALSATLCKEQHPDLAHYVERVHTCLKNRRETNMPRSVAWSVMAVKEELAKREVLLCEREYQSKEEELHTLRLRLTCLSERLEELSSQRRALEET